MKRKSPIIWFYLVGMTVIFLIVNNTNLLSDSKEVTTVQQLEQNNSSKSKELKSTTTNVLNIMASIAVIGLIIVLFQARKEQNKEVAEVFEEDVKNDLKDDISYLGRYCVDFKITIEDLQELAKKKSN